MPHSCLRTCEPFHSEVIDFIQEDDPEAITEDLKGVVVDYCRRDVVANQNPEAPAVNLAHHARQAL